MSTVPAPPSLSSTSVASGSERIDWLRCTPFVLLHVAVAGVVVVGVSPIAIGLAVALYVVRMFAVTAFYHRYFSHRAFKASRGVQFAMALVAGTAAQRGPLWWAAHHRHHHIHSDHDHDLHSPSLRGVIMSHCGWFMTKEAYRTDERYVRDWLRFPELVWLDRFDWVMPAVLAGALFALGTVLEHTAPALQTNGGQLVVWGFVISTVVLYHATYTINSLAHRWGRRRYPTDDDSRNNGWLAVLTLGEGWHNNHHHYPASARQGFYWWEFDPTYYVLRAMAAAGVIRDLRAVPERVLEAGRAADEETRS